MKYIIPTLLATFALLFSGCGGAFDTLGTKISKSFTINGDSSHTFYVNSTPPVADANTTTTATNQFTVDKYPDNGTITFTDTTVVYVPDTSFSGTDTYEFSYYDDFRNTKDIYTITITVRNVNGAATIVGTGPSSIVAGQTYSFTPIVVDNDTPASALKFSISSKPGWASFNASTGTLSGTPATKDIGSYDNILIAVSDGTNTSFLDVFSIEVLAP